MTMTTSRLSRATFFLFCLFCVAYVIAVIGVAFNVHPQFSMTWAGSVLLILEGVLITVAMMDLYGPTGLLAALFVGLFAYGIEALGVHTGFPFGTYHYTNVLAPILPGGVPLAVLFAWITIMLSIRSLLIMQVFKSLAGCINIVLLPILATLLDLELEPTAFHLEHFWVWQNAGSISYYGVPPVNFLAWFILTAIIIVIIGIVFARGSLFINPFSFTGSLPVRIPWILYAANIFMFGLIDITHGYYLGVVFGIVAGILLWIMSSFPNYASLAMANIDGIEEDQTFEPERKRVHKTKKASKKKRR
jgi:uncharacterized membrane protein